MPLFTVIRNWQPKSASTGGHCENCERPDLAVNVSVVGALALQVPPLRITMPLNVAPLAYVWVPLTELLVES